MSIPPTNSKLLELRVPLLAFGAGIGITLIVLKLLKKMKSLKKKKYLIKKTTILDCVGNTPLIYLPVLSQVLECEIYCKAEHLNPFGSSKDRAVKRMITEARQNKQFTKSNVIVQASSGSTAISLALISKIMGLKTTLYLPNDLASDKYTYLQTVGANIVKVPPVSIVDPNHFFKRAQYQSEISKGFFMNQFENPHNFKVHLIETGPEIYEQTKGKIDAFVASAGTGGTIAGVSYFLKSKDKNIKIILADPEGSGLYNKVKYGVLYTRQERQGYRLKNPFDTVIEGVGLNRQTNNFTQAIIDDAQKVKDLQALHMAHYLIQNEGLFVGSSSALNLAAVVKYARKHKGSTIVTVTSDAGNRYLKKFYSQQYLRDKKIHFEKKTNYDRYDLDFIE